MTGGCANGCKVCQTDARVEVEESIMLVIERVRQRIVRLAPAAACDDCLGNAVKVRPRQQVNHKTRELARLSVFDRRIGYCSLCELNTKLVIRYTGAAGALRGSG